jgi:hypothetical protein
VKIIRSVWTAAVLACSLTPIDAAGQAPDRACAVTLRTGSLAGPSADLARLLDLHDSGSLETFTLRRTGRRYLFDACRAPAAIRSLAEGLDAGTRRGMDIVPAEALLTGNSAYPRDGQDGSLWGGRGLGMSIQTGVEFGWGPFSAAIAPVYAWQQNREFDMLPNASEARSPWAHRWWGTIIDAPQRFGPSSYGRLDLGQSYARIDLFGAGVGISSENLTWGPARRNPLLLSGSAPGFPHVFLETTRPADVFIGALEAQLFWARLTESDWFDDDPDNDHRVLAGLLVALRPHVFDGLTIGGARMYSRTWWPGLPLSEIMFAPYRGVRDNPQQFEAGDNQLLGFFFRWAFAPAGMEVYGEWAREDHWDGWIGLLRNLDASQAWMLGLQSVVTVRHGVLRISTEIAHLAEALPTMHPARGPVAFYSHSTVVQGHTHRGQLLGAPVGTGGESQFLGLDWFWSGGRSGISVERARYEDDAYNIYYAAQYGSHARDTELSVRGGHMSVIGGIAIDAEIGWSRRYNRHFLGLDTASVTGAPYRTENNWSLRLGTRWHPRGLRR